MLKAPEIAHRWNAREKTLEVEAVFTDGSEPESNALWWAVDKSEPFTLPFEYDRWRETRMQKIGRGKYAGEIRFEEAPKRLDILTVHTHVENELPLTISSHYLRVR